MLQNVPLKDDITESYNRIVRYIHRTPIFTSETIDYISGASMHFKAENLQKVGAFKYRGATNAILSLPKEKLVHGVCTHSSGNHAQALALAAKNMGVKSYIVMPSNSPQVKKNAVAGYGGIIIECEPTLAARESTLADVVKEHQAAFIHPYDNYDVIAGQGSCAFEIIQELGHPDYIVVPVGGGGLLSGTLLAAHYFSPQTKIIAAEPEGASDAWKTFATGVFHPSVNPTTIADGLLTSLGEYTWPIIRQYVSDIITVSDEDIIAAMRLVWERMKLVIEPSAAVSLAAVLHKKQIFANKRVVAIFTGGNVDLSRLPF